MSHKPNPVRDAEFSSDVERPRRGRDARGAGGPGAGHSSALIGNVRFDADVMVATMNEASRPCWDEWESVTAPTLVVHGEKGMLRPRRSLSSLTVAAKRDAWASPEHHTMHTSMPSILG